MAITITKPNHLGLSRKYGAAVLQFIIESIIPRAHSISNLIKKTRPKLYSNPTVKITFGAIWVVVGIPV